MKEGAMVVLDLTQMAKQSKNIDEMLKQQKEMEQIDFGNVK